MLVLSGITVGLWEEGVHHPQLQESTTGPETHALLDKDQPLYKQPQ